MTVREIVNSVYAVGALDWDRRVFDELVHLPDGTTYNSYLIKGSEKTVLIDAADPESKKEFLDNLSELSIDKIDYIVSHHAEQDHSGLIVDILDKYPQAKVVTNTKCKDLLMDLLPISENKFKVVADGEQLSLGDKTLQFILMPWVHWPETMGTYLQEDKVLFSCDLFGAHLATSDLFVPDKKYIEEAAKRYYAEIMMPFRNQIQKHLAKLGELKIDYILPSHGPVYDQPQIIIDLYKGWISDDVKNKVVIPYISMHHSVKQAVKYLEGILIEKGVEVVPFNLADADTGRLAMEILDAASIVVATPTFMAGVHPKVMYATVLLNLLRPKTRYLGVITSFGWAGRAVEIIQENTKNIKAEAYQPVKFKGSPKGEALKELESLALDIVKKHQTI